MLAPSFRAASRADLPTILTLLAELDRDGKPPMPLNEAEARFARMATYPDFTVWLAEMDAVIVGTFTLLIMDNLGHHGTPEGIVENVVVIDAWQGRGVGRAMMDYAMARCRAAGCYKMALTSNLKRTDAHAFYDRLGFTRHGISFIVDPSTSSQSER